MRFFDCSKPLISLRHMSMARAAGAIVGSGNTGPLINCDTGGFFYGASLISATTSDLLPYMVNGVPCAIIPVTDPNSGDEVYR
jgi:hypothetical protein